MREPGLFEGVPAAEYHAAPNELSVSGAKTLIRKTPLHYMWERTHPVHKDVFDFGSAAHSFALEGDSSPFIEIPDELLASNGAASTKPAKEFIEQAREDGKIPLKSDAIRKVKGMAEALRAHEAASVLLAAGRPEVSAYRRHDTGVMLQSRFDWLPDDLTIIPDYKTA